MKECHQRGADKLLDLAKANGGVFIKVSFHYFNGFIRDPETYTSIVDYQLFKLQY